VGDKVFPWQGVLPLVLSYLPCMGGPFLSDCVPSLPVCTTCLPYLCFSSLSPCLLFHTCTTSPSTAPTGCSLPFAPHPGYRCVSDSAVTSLSQCSAITAWHGFFLWFSLQVPRVGRLEGHGITILCFPCPRRSCSGQSGGGEFLFAPL
jgi:hypothetical protein